MSFFESYPFAEEPPSSERPLSEPERNSLGTKTPDTLPPQESKELRDLIKAEGAALRRFFGYDIDVPRLPRSVTPERMKAWREKGMDLHYLPPEELLKERILPGGRGKPSRLPGYWIMIERREKHSRVGFSWEDLHLPGFKEMIARLLGVPLESVRPARAIELNYLTNAFNEEHRLLDYEENHAEQSDRRAASEPHPETRRPPLVVVLSATAEGAN